MPGGRTLMAASVAIVLAAGCAAHPPAPHGALVMRPTSAASGPIFAGAPPARLVVAVARLGVTPDGTYRFLVRTSFRDEHGAPTVLLSGGNVDVTTMSRDVTVQWQTRLRYGGPAAVVSFARPGSADVVVRATVGPPVPAVRLRLQAPGSAPGVAVAVAAHEVELGWWPPTGAGPVRIERAEGRSVHTVGAVESPGATFRDTTVGPGRRYRYTITKPVGTGGNVSVLTLSEPHGAQVAALAGKAMWLSFSPSTLDDDAYSKLDPASIVARAASAGIRSIQLRTAYGPFSEITPDDRAMVDGLLDAAAAHGIAVIAWTVPRGPDFDDLANAVAAAEHHTARGVRFAALALDLERGDGFLGDGASGRAALAAYPALVRAALGPRYPIVATVEDPFLEHLTSRDYPYAAIARSASVLQPMIYWRMMSRRITTPNSVRGALRGSYAALTRAAGRRMPIDIGGQTTSEDSRAAPSPAELAAAVTEAKRLGALGITFFDWGGTSEGAWTALGSVPW